MRGWGAVQIAAASLGAALVVFFAGATAAVAAGASPPTALWAAGGAISGGLLGLLVPSPAPKGVIQAAADAKTRALKQSVAEVAGPGPGAVAGAGAAPEVAPGALPVRIDPVVRATSWLTVWVLLGAFIVLVTLSVFLAGGAITPPKSFGPESLQNLVKTLIALASGAGTAFIGLLAPDPGSSN